MSENVIIANKKKGQTPLECLQEVKNTDPKFRSLPMTYAGRLDPLASGVLLILVGDECLKKDEYLALSKEYEVTILFGFATDTYDVLGEVVFSEASRTSSGNPFSGPRVGSPDQKKELTDSLLPLLKNFTGRITQAYPPYSSRTVDGKPLFQWAREGKIDQITIPSHDVFVESIDIMKMGTITGKKLHETIKKDIARVSGDFRQEEILQLWNDALSNKGDIEFQTVTLKIACGGGVYVRSIAHELGITLGVPALALNIVRTKVGEYSSALEKK